MLADNFTQERPGGTFSGDFTPLFVLLLGAIGMSGEWRHKTITGTVLAAPAAADRLLAGEGDLLRGRGRDPASFAVSDRDDVVGTLILSSRGMPTR